jgi:hypothetical protein
MNTRSISNFFRSGLVVSVFFIGFTNMNPVLAAACTADTSTIADCTGPLDITISTAGTISNAMVITSTGSSGSVIGVDQDGSISLGGFTNTGTITATATSNWSGFGIYKYTSSIKTTLTNTGSITGTAAGSGSGYGIYNHTTATITTLINSNSITGSSTGSGSGYGIVNSTISSSITTLTNTGSITGTSASGAAFGILNVGTITTLNNSQGAGNAAGALTYTGVLPTNYNVIITSASNYGKLSGTSVTGSTNFGIYAGATITTKLYTGVLEGLTTSNVGATRTGTYSGLSYTLALQSGSSTIWDLIFTGGSTADTQQSLVNTASALQGTYTLQNSVIANSFSYDCSVFGANNVCVSAGGRNTAVAAANGLNNTSALLIAAYRPHPNYRIGAYADQNLSVSNPGGTVNLGNNTPLLGLFAAWNERLNGTGTEVKVSAAYGQKNATVTRAVVGTSEAGSGSSNLISQGAQVTAKYGFAVIDKVIVSPYIGMRYTQNNMAGYTEGTSSSVTAPLTYSALNTNATTALAGVGASYRVIPAVTTFASAGVESDTNTSNGTYSATGVAGLTPLNFNANPVKTRPTATLGAHYDIAKNQRLGVTGTYRQEAYQALSTTTVMATYTIGL